MTTVIFFSGPNTYYPIVILGEEKGANILTPRIIMLRERRRKPTLFPFDALTKGYIIRFALVYRPSFEIKTIDGSTTIARVLVCKGQWQQRKMLN